MNISVPKQINKTVVPKVSFWKKHKKFILITGINLLLLAGLIIGLFFGLKKKKNGGDQPIPVPPPGSTPSCSKHGTWSDKLKKCVCAQYYSGPSCETNTQKWYCGLDNSTGKRKPTPCLGPAGDECPPAGAPVNTFLNAPAPSCSERGPSSPNWWCRTYDSEDSCRDDGCKKVSNLSPCVDSSFCKIDSTCCYNDTPCAGTDPFPGKGVCRSGDCPDPSEIYTHGKHCPLYTCDMCESSGTPLSPERIACCTFLNSSPGGNVNCSKNIGETCGPAPPPPPYSHANTADCSQNPCGGTQEWNCKNIGQLGTYTPFEIPTICCPTTPDSGGGGQAVWTLACDAQGNCANPNGTSDDDLSWACSKTTPQGNWKHTIPTLPLWSYYSGWTCDAIGQWIAQDNGYTCCPPDPRYWPYDGSSYIYKVEGGACTCMNC